MVDLPQRSVGEDGALDASLTAYVSTWRRWRVERFVVTLLTLMKATRSARGLLTQRSKRGDLQLMEEASVIPLVIPLGTTPDDRAVSPGRVTRPDQQGRHPARRHGRSLLDF